MTMNVSGQCGVYRPELLVAILDALMLESFGAQRGLYEFELYRLMDFLDDNDSAVTYLESAFENTGDPTILFIHAQQLIIAERYDAALTYIDRAIERLGQYNNIRTGTRASKRAVLLETREKLADYLTD